jgi:hypothetical protein
VDTKTSEVMPISGHEAIYSCQSSFKQLQENMSISFFVLWVEMSRVVVLADVSTAIPQRIDIAATEATNVYLDQKRNLNQEIQASVSLRHLSMKMICLQSHMATNSQYESRHTITHSVFDDITADSRLRGTGLQAKSASLRVLPVSTQLCLASSSASTPVRYLVYNTLLRTNAISRS